MIYWVAANGARYRRDPACPGLASQQAGAGVQPGGEQHSTAYYRSETDAREAALEHAQCDVPRCFPPPNVRGLGWGLLTLNNEIDKHRADRRWRDLEAD